MEFLIKGDCESVLSKLFHVGEDGHLHLGWSAVSVSPATFSDLTNGTVEFRDYLMEGFVPYSVEAIDCQLECRLTVRGKGSNRDQYIRPQVRHFITAAGLSITAENP